MVFAVLFLCSCRAEEADPHAVFDSAGEAFEAGNPALAESLLVQVTVLEPGNANALYNLGTVRMSVGDYNGAVQAYRQVIEADSSRVDALTGLAGALVGAGRLEEALETGAMAVELNPSDGMAFNHYGMALLETGSYSEAASCFNTALRRSPNNPSVLYNCGNISMMAGDAEKALQYFESVLSLSPNHYGAATGRARALGMLERHQEAEEAALVIIAAWPGDLQGRELLALAYSEQGRFSEAIEVLERMIQDCPNNPMVRLGLAECYQGMGDMESALVEYESFMLMLPDTSGTASIRNRIALLEGICE